MTEKLPKATYRGRVEIGDIRIPCAVLENGTRVLSEHGVTIAMRSRSGASKRSKRIEQEKGGAPLPVFMASNNLKPFISNDLRIGLINPIKYRVGKRIAQGFPAELLPQICDVWLKARDEGALNTQQLRKCRQAEILMRGLAHVGIIALVDEATGYQEVREREELQKILRMYISDELLPWTRRFPTEFYKEMFRLRGWRYPPTSDKGAPRGPRYAGKITKELVYEKLPRPVLEELEKRNPPDQKWQRRHRHHQWLTNNIGNPHLEKQVAIVTTLMRVASNWRSFERLFQRAFPSGPEQLEMEFIQEVE